MVDAGRWPPTLNALWNGFSDLLFLCSLILIFLPIFAGQLFPIRDIFASSFFRPLAKVSFSVFALHGVAIYFALFTEFQTLHFDHKTLFFYFFALAFIAFIIGVLIAVLFEYPFRTMMRLLIFPSNQR